MNSKKQNKKSRRYEQIWSVYQTISSRSRHLLRLLSRKRVRRNLLESAFFGLLGAGLYEICARLFFGLSLWPGITELYRLHGPLFWWGSIILISVIIGGWSVVGASWHVLGLCWKWARLYPAGGK